MNTLEVNYDWVKNIESFLKIPCFNYDRSNGDSTVFLLPPNLEFIDSGQDIVEMGNTLPFRERNPKVFFRGNQSGV